MAFETARALLEQGLAGLALFDISFVQSVAAIELLRNDFPSSRIVVKTVDITNAAGVEAATVETARELGSVDILCCFAGVVGCTHALDMSPEEWRRTLEVNTTGGFLCAQAAARHVSPSTDLLLGIPVRTGLADI